ncbi:MAG: hypothetical protein ABIP13_00720 [Tepidiformaceae bacterium]
MPARVLLAFDVALKFVLVALLAMAVAFPDSAQFEGKAMGARALTYPLTTVIVPAAWWAFARRRAFPTSVDILLVLPFLIDTAGNALDLYDSVDWWDDANHLVNWAILSTAAGLALRPLKLAWLNEAGLVLGFGAVTAIAWELLEYYAFIRDSPELATAYTDTLGDLALGTTGSLFSGLAVALWSRRSNPLPLRPSSLR